MYGKNQKKQKQVHKPKACGGDQDRSRTPDYPGCLLAIQKIERSPVTDTLKQLLAASTPQSFISKMNKAVDDVTEDQKEQREEQQEEQEEGKQEQ